jgi:hypothetical protein
VRACAREEGAAGERAGSGPHGCSDL